jgi:site-specific DNA recombinase
MIEKAKKGEFCGVKPPYGYKVVDKLLIIDEKQAVIVREVYRLFLEGTTIMRFARIMNERKVPTDGTAKEWWPSKVYRILSNPMYAGYMAYNRRHPVGTRIIKNPKEKHVIVEGLHEGIVSKENFKKVQEILSNNPVFSIRRVTLLSGLLHCGKCRCTLCTSYAKKIRPG